MKVFFLSTLPEEEWKRYQSELERKAGVTWNRVIFMERTWEVIRRYGTQSVKKVGLNQPIMREILQKLMNAGKTGRKVVNQKVVKSKTSAVVALLVRAARPGESG